ncbi:RecQ family ATP-dependent DNA helicase [Microbacterium sp. nov. GSS16]|uniref:RecQ family ATP-dependent DNA helicase n=1 Tax=Microbacterium sp. nov. GSS16 TaxID=3019890 RepID=UPI002305AD10|nr:RecQ family ATP-dependent DNA helicase [Microbacterium sp. nov. GSS16]WCD92551.1 RecQ family ATP-dependent DNA helicase [Microbacterium sp. nov. GSS16]
MIPDDIDRVARESFGIDQLKPAQRDAIEAAVSGRDVLGVLATGYGKSVMYQIAATLREGVTVVVSPLIALQEDQLVGIESAPGAPAAVTLNSAGGVRRKREAWRMLRSGQAEFVLLAPEQLAKEEVITALAALDVSLLVVDEAHCIASWGHDFRPDYLMLGAVAERLGRPPIMALTATASTPVRAEISRRLGMRDPFECIGELDRPEIALSVRRHTDDAAKRAAVEDEVVGLPKPGLVYTATRRDTEQYAQQLQERGLRAAAYHAGMPAKSRAQVHEDLLDDRLDVVVATSAFGMGIDKPNVRFVVHADAPESVDAYYQEVGRAGRDGEPAQATLHFRPEDLALRKYFAGRKPAGGEIRRLLRALKGGSRRRAELAEASGLSARRVTALLALLSDTGHVRIGRSGATLLSLDAAAAVSDALERVEERERIDQSRIEMMRSYAETRRCRRQVLLGYFGDELDDPCGNCDTCDAGVVDDGEELSGETDSGFQVDDRVRHREWGAGTVMSVEDDRMTVFFEAEGYRVLSLELIEEKDLLERVSSAG